MDEQTKQDGRIFAILSYFHIIGAIIAIIMNHDKKNPFTAFHVRQGLGLTICFMIVGFLVSGFDSWNATRAFWLAFFVLYIYGIYGAATLKTTPIPILGDLFQKIFKGIGS